MKDYLYEPEPSVIEKGLLSEVKQLFAGKGAPDEFQDITVLEGDAAFTADLLRVSLIRSLPEIFGPAYNES